MSPSTTLPVWWRGWRRRQSVLRRRRGAGPETAPAGVGLRRRPGDAGRHVSSVGGRRRWPPHICAAGSSTAGARTRRGGCGGARQRVQPIVDRHRANLSRRHDGAGLARRRPRRGPIYADLRVRKHHRAPHRADPGTRAGLRRVNEPGTGQERTGACAGVAPATPRRGRVSAASVSCVDETNPEDALVVNLADDMLLTVNSVLNQVQVDASGTVAVEPGPVILRDASNLFWGDGETWQSGLQAWPDDVVAVLEQLRLDELLDVLVLAFEVEGDVDLVFVPAPCSYRLDGAPRRRTYRDHDRGYRDASGHGGDHAGPRDRAGAAAGAGDRGVPCGARVRCRAGGHRHDRGHRQRPGDHRRVLSPGTPAGSSRAGSRRTATTGCSSWESGPLSARTVATLCACPQRSRTRGLPRCFGRARWAASTSLRWYVRSNDRFEEPLSARPVVRGSVAESFTVEICGAPRDSGVLVGGAD